MRLPSEQLVPPRGGGAIPVDRRAAAVAARQFGVVTYRQLVGCGLSRDRVQHRVAAGQLQRLWRGVYAFGHQELKPQGRLLAAVFACGSGAVLSHRSAAAHWGLLQTAAARIDVSVPRGGGRTQRPGIRVHTSRRLDPEDVTEREGIPITTVARTLVDLCAVANDRQLEKALEQAYVLRLLAPGAIDDALARAGGRKTVALRRLLRAERRAATITRSELEERFLALVRRAGLPDPEVNARLYDYEVDFLWRAQRRVIEVDGHAYHSTRQAASRDRRKDDDLETAGYRVTRFTADQVLHDPSDTLARTRRALGR
jgi:very-short-patch-repair endonuclease